MDVLDLHTRGLFNNCLICLTTAVACFMVIVKMIVKLWYLNIITAMTYDQNSGLHCGYKRRTTYKQAFHKANG